MISKAVCCMTVSCDTYAEKKIGAHEKDSEKVSLLVCLILLLTSYCVVSVNT